MTQRGMSQRFENGKEGQMHSGSAHSWSGPVGGLSCELQEDRPASPIHCLTSARVQIYMPMEDMCHAVDFREPSGGGC